MKKLFLFLTIVTIAAVTAVCRPEGGTKYLTLVDVAREKNILGMQVSRF